MAGSRSASKVSKGSAKSMKSKASMKGASKAQRGGAGLPGIKENSVVSKSEAGTSDLDIGNIPYELEPRRNIVTDEEFDEMVKKGEFLEHHKDLFKHELV